MLGDTACNIGNGLVDVHRPVGSEYLNTYNKTIARVFKCNHDIRLLSGSQGSECVYYCIKYCTKQQNEIENVDTVILNALDKRLRREVNQEGAGMFRWRFV